jgi:hypothetical protein
MEEMGLMGTRTGWLALLLTAGVLLAPTRLCAQSQQTDDGSAAGPRLLNLIARGQVGDEVPPGDPQVPLPLYSHPGSGFYAGAEFEFWKQTNPLKDQVIAVRGLVDFDGSITAALNGVPFQPTNGPIVIVPGQPIVGAFIGSGQPALLASDAGGPGSFEPGVRLFAGWLFQNQVAVEFSYMTLAEAKYGAVATLVPPSLNGGPNLVNTFLFSQVYNFPPEFAGAPNKLAIGNPFAAYGIWNAASVESISFVQRYDEYNLGARIPIFDTDFCRAYGLVGGRHVALWERFTWRTISENFDGSSDATDVAIYSNVVSNEMYGVYIGSGMDWWLGHGFAVSLDGKVDILADFVHEIAKYERGDLAIASKRSRREYEFVPEFDASVNIWWYPFEGVQVRAGYNIMEFLNTISSPDPVNFNYGGLDATWISTSRFFEGFNFGISFIF